MGSPGNSRSIRDGTFLHRKATVDSFGQLYSRPTDIDHDNIHSGNAFSFSVLNAALAAGAELVVLLTIGAGKEGHLRINASSDGPATLRFLEKPTTSGTGTTLALLNRNRIINRAATHSAVSGVTITGVGTQLFIRRLPGSSGGFFSPGSGSAFDANDEWVLKPGNTYAIGVTNNDTGPESVSIDCLIYERAIS